MCISLLSASFTKRRSFPAFIATMLLIVNLALFEFGDFVHLSDVWGWQTDLSFIYIIKFVDNVYGVNILVNSCDNKTPYIKTVQVVYIYTFGILNANSQAPKSLSLFD